MDKCHCDSCRRQKMVKSWSATSDISLTISLWWAVGGGGGGVCKATCQTQLRLTKVELQFLGFDNLSN